MHVISRKKLRDFWSLHGDAETPLDAWYQIAKRADWESFDQVKTVFGKRVDRVDRFAVFDIGGNKYRLIAVIHYDRRKIYIRHVLTHAEYDLNKWKKG